MRSKLRSCSPKRKPFHERVEAFREPFINSVAFPLS
jgi:hypothetical protein